MSVRAPKTFSHPSHWPFQQIGTLLQIRILWCSEIPKINRHVFLLLEPSWMIVNLFYVLFQILLFFKVLPAFHHSWMGHYVIKYNNSSNGNKWVHVIQSILIRIVKVSINSQNRNLQPRFGKSWNRILEQTLLWNMTLLGTEPKNFSKLCLTAASGTAKKLLALRYSGRLSKASKTKTCLLCCCSISKMALA